MYVWLQSYYQKCFLLSWNYERNLNFQQFKYEVTKSNSLLCIEVSKYICVILSIYNLFFLPLALLYQPPTSSKIYLIFPHLWDFLKIIALCWCHRSCQMAHGLQACSPSVSTVIWHFWPWKEKGSEIQINTLFWTLYYKFSFSSFSLLPEIYRPLKYTDHYNSKKILNKPKYI